MDKNASPISPMLLQSPDGRVECIASFLFISHLLIDSYKEERSSFVNSYCYSLKYCPRQKWWNHHTSQDPPPPTPQFFIYLFNEAAIPLYTLASWMMLTFKRSSLSERLFVVTSVTVGKMTVEAGPRSLQTKHSFSDRLTCGVTGAETVGLRILAALWWWKH